jgi:capsular exopolysaccharide synthesis family protein
MESDSITVVKPTTEQTNSFVDILFHYLSYWRYYIVSFVVCIGMAYTFLRYSTPIYSVRATVIIGDSKTGQSTSDINTTAFNDLGISQPRSNLENEIAVLLSRSLRETVGDSLHLGISYFKTGRIKRREIYKFSPVLVSIPNVTRSGIFTILSDSNDVYNVFSESDKTTLAIPKDTPTPTPWGIATFHANPFAREVLPVEVTIAPGAIPSISISTEENSNVVTLSAVSSVPEKAQDIVNTLIAIYNRNSINEKNFTATNTINFIAERQGDLSHELNATELELESYNKERGIVDLRSQQQIALTSTNEFDQQIRSTDLQLELLRSTKNFLLNPDNDNKVVPTNIGLSDQTVLSLLNAYNVAVLEKEKNAVGMKGDHYVLKEYNDQITSLKDNVLRGIAISESTLEHTIQLLQKQENMFVGLSRNLTSQERESRGLSRKQNIKESIFIYLSQKREEVGISMAEATPNAKIIDPASARFISLVAPLSNSIYSRALLIALLLPTLIIFLHDIFDTKIHIREDITDTVKAPFLGEVPFVKKTDIFPVLKVKSSIAEFFRLIVSNLEFVVNDQTNRVILVTSSTGNEGKSFFSRNLALSLATTGKKTLLMDLDMRKSVLESELNIKTKSGIALYLSDKTVPLKHIIDTSHKFHKNLDIIPIKVFPPNPAELLVSERMSQLFAEITPNYDYIIIDTAPIGLVSDAYRISHFASATIYLTRSNYTLKRSLVEIQKLYAENKLPNLTCALNASTGRKKYGYSYGYGYGYGYYKHNYYTED